MGGEPGFGIAIHRAQLENLERFHLLADAGLGVERIRRINGKDRERKTEIMIFDDIEASKVVMRNTKLYVNRKEGFIGTSLKRDEYVTDCSDIDDVIVFTKEGKMMVTKVDTKTFVGKDILHVAVFKKKDKRTIYNMIYRDGTGGSTYVKRFNVTSMTRDREYDMTNGKKGSQVLYFTANPNGEAEVVTIYLRAIGNIKKLKFDLDLADVLIKGRNSKGNIVSKHSVRTVELKEKGLSTLKPRKIWFDETVLRLNVDGRGELLGEFKAEDRLLIVTQKGIVKTIKPELTTRFTNDMVVLEKWKPEKPISAVYWDGTKERYFVKRFLIENLEREELIITEDPHSHLEVISTDHRPVIEMVFYKERGKDQKEPEEVNLEEFISVKGIKAIGNQLFIGKLKQINILDSLPYEEEEPLEKEDIEVVGEEEVEGDDTGSQNEDLPKKDDEGSTGGQASLFD